MGSTPLRIGLALLCGLGVAACGDDDDSSNGGSASGTATTAEGGSGSESTGEDVEVAQVNVGAVPATSAVLLWTALEQGIFEEHHLEVELQPANGGAATVPALQGGAIQVGQANILSAVQGQLGGLDIPCFIGNARLSPRGAFLPLIASEQSGATTAADLEGATIAVNAIGGVQQLLASAYLEAEGVDVDSIEWVAVDIPAAAGAVTSGQVDAAIMTAPFSNIALRQGATMIAANPEEAIDENLSFACYIATREWLDENPDVAERFRDALADALAYLEENPEAEIEIIARNLDADPALFEGALPLITGDLTEDDVQEWIDLGLRYEIIPEAVPAEDVLWQP